MSLNNTKPLIGVQQKYKVYVYNIRCLLNSFPDNALVIEGWVHYGCHIKLYKNSCEPQILTNLQ